MEEKIKICTLLKQISQHPQYGLRTKRKKKNPKCINFILINIY